MTRRRNLVRTGGLLTMCAVAAIGAVAPTRYVADAAAPTFGLVQQTFNVPAEGTLRLRVSLPKGVALPVDFTIAVTAFRPVATRNEVADAVNGVVGSSIDTVTLLPLAVPRPATGQLQVDVPTEITTKTKPALQLSAPGVYPLAVELREGKEVLAELHTFVHRVPGDAETAEDPLLVAVAMSTEAPVSLDDRAKVQIDDATVTELTTLAEVLEQSKVSVAVRIPPAVLTALADTGAEGAALSDRLSTALDRHELLSSPALPLDPSLAAGADQGSVYTQWLRDGEDALAGFADVSSRRTVGLVDQPLSEQGGNLLRNLGARMLLLPPDLYDALPNSFGGFTDTTQLVQIQVAENITIDATVTDRTAGPKLARNTTTPLLSAIHQVADLLAARQQIEDQGGEPSRHAITLAAPDLSLPSTSGFGEFTALLATTPGLRPATLDEVSVRTDQLLGPDGLVVVNLPTSVDGDLQPRIDLLTALGLEAASTSSMLPDDDSRLPEWSRLIDVLPTSALTDTQAAGIATALRAQFDGLKSSVTVPTGFSFNLTSKRGSVPVTLRNDADIPLKVRVRMTSPKLTFPDGDQTVELAPRAFKEVRVNIEARTNGTSNVTLEVFTPLGDALIAPAVPLTASIRNLAGVGNMVTGAALLVLLTWWVRHWRRNQRGRRAAEATNRHPATRADGETGNDTSGLSPDAATSTLPPS